MHSHRESAEILICSVGNAAWSARELLELGVRARRPGRESAARALWNVNRIPNTRTGSGPCVQGNAITCQMWLNFDSLQLFTIPMKAYYAYMY